MRDLTRPGALSPGATAVEWRETHISWLFFLVDRVFKVKKPVRTPFLDYSTLEARRFFCEEEVRLGRRLAPEVYLGVRELRSAPDGIRLGGEGELVEHAVEMVRLPADCLLENRLAEHRVPEGTAQRVAELLHRFHRDAATGAGVDEHGRFERVRATDRATRQGVRDLGASLVPAAILDALDLRAERFLRRHEPLFHRRVLEHHVREGHGDLHAGNLCLYDDGRIVAYDCIEFSRALRCLDEAAELSFLTMDLARRGARSLARAVTDASVAVSADPERRVLQPFYEAHYAMVRAHVALLRAAQLPPDSDESRERLAEARRSVVHSYSCGNRPWLLVTCGLPGSGKSHLCRDLAQVFDLEHLQSDVVRKELLGLDPHRRSDPRDAERIYSAQSTARTYATLAERAHAILDRGHGVVVDANFPTAAMRAPLRTLAAELRVPLLWLECSAPESAVRERLEARAHEAHEASDADFRVYLAARERFEPPDELPAAQRLPVRPGTTPQERRTAVAEHMAMWECARPGGGAISGRVPTC